MYQSTTTRVERKARRAPTSFTPTQLKNDPQFKNAILKYSAKLLQKPRLSKPDIDIAISTINKLDDRIFRTPKDIKSLLHLISTYVKKAINNATCVETEFDAHELLKSSIGLNSEASTSFSALDATAQDNASKTALPQATVGVSSFIGSSDPFSLQQIINPSALRTTNYMFLDSRYRNLGTDGRTKLVWDYQNNLTTQQGTVNMVGSVRDIVQFKVYGFRIPYVTSADTPQKKISMTIEEFRSQSFIAHENIRFHFLFDVKADGDYLNLVPSSQNNGVFKFSKPFTEFSSISLTFGAPLSSVTFDYDRLSCTFTYGSTTTVSTGSENHNLVSGDIVYFEDFDTDASVVDQSTITTMNRSSGHIVTVTTDTAFTIAVDTSSITGTSGLSITGIFDSKRIQIAMEVVSLKSTI